MSPKKIKPSALNYTRYPMAKYDRDIVNSIPFHKKIHQLIGHYVQKHFDDQAYDVLDLGAGTGITSHLVQAIIPNAQFDIVDFSDHMLSCAKNKLGPKNIRYLKTDYSSHSFIKKYDIVVSIIGFHHQTHAGKRALFKKIYSLLKPGGVFIFGDLVTFRDQRTAAYNHALHFSHLVKKSTDKKTLTDWAHHHQFLNNPAPLEDQIDWLKNSGFRIVKIFHRFNTALIISKN